MCANFARARARGDRLGPRFDWPRRIFRGFRHASRRRPPILLPCAFRWAPPWKLSSGTHPADAGLNEQQDACRRALGISLKTLHNKLKEYEAAQGSFAVTRGATMHLRETKITLIMAFLVLAVVGVNSTLYVADAPPCNDPQAMNVPIVRVTSFSGANRSGPLARGPAAERLRFWAAKKT